MALPSYTDLAHRLSGGMYLGFRNAVSAPAPNFLRGASKPLPQVSDAARASLDRLSQQFSASLQKSAVSPPATLPGYAQAPLPPPALWKPLAPTPNLFPPASPSPSSVPELKLSTLPRPDFGFAPDVGIHVVTGGEQTTSVEPAFQGLQTQVLGMSDNNALRYAVQATQKLAAFGVDTGPLVAGFPILGTSQGEITGYVKGTDWIRNNRFTPEQALAWIQINQNVWPPGTPIHDAWNEAYLEIREEYAVSQDWAI